MKTNQTSDNIFKRGIGYIKDVISSLSLTEKAILFVLTIVLIVSSLSLLLKLNSELLVEIPKFGGTLKEGVVGTPRFINPLLALSETDRDISALVYSGLMRLDENGNLIPDLAKEYTVSEDGLEYTFILKDDITFHDGKKVTTDDIVFTISKTQDPGIKSTKRANWDSVVVDQISEKEIKFILAQPYSPFIFNTTIGILPKHLWENINNDEFAFTIYNTEPIGTGPYMISKVKTNSTGIATKYTLKAFSDFAIRKPHIKKIEMFFFKNEEEVLEALEDGIINSVHSISPQKAKELDEEYNVRRVTLPRVFGVFFNQSQAPVLANKGVREALDVAVPKQKIIDEVMYGFADVANSPIPPSRTPFETLEAPIPEINHKDEALAILIENGWELNEDKIMEKKGTKLSFSISTANIPELIQVAEIVVQSFRDIGAEVELKVFQPNDLNQNVIRARKYDSLLFGEVVGHDLDLYAFWHSSQRNDPGLNIADYANVDVDKLILKARITKEKEELSKIYKEIEENIIKDIPAVFIYSPYFTYIVPEDLEGNIPQNITTPSERYSNVYNWYLETDKVWSFFKKD